jgi:cytochrome d ubiquinol oxidase subunit II
VATRRGRDGWAFTATAVAVLATTATLFLALYPAVLPSTVGPAGDLTVGNAAASGYALRVMTWTALAFAPLVLGYQTWTYWVFRRRLTATAVDTGSTAADHV